MTLRPITVHGSHLVGVGGLMGAETADTLSLITLQQSRGLGTWSTVVSETIKLCCMTARSGQGS
jgi:hypothetical protein